MTEPRRGRPPLDENDRTTGVSVKMPSRLYDDACQLAEKQRVSLPEVIRRAVRRAVHDDDE